MATVRDLQRLLRETFPGEAICVTAEYWVHARGGESADMTIYATKTHKHDSCTIVARDLDDAISRMRDFLAGGPTPDVGAESLVPMSATISETPLVRIGQGTSETTIMPSDVIAEGGAV